jgi:hypothetical protein
MCIEYLDHFSRPLQHLHHINELIQTTSDFKALCELGGYRISRPA